jgi:hypothetical protein
MIITMDLRVLGLEDSDKSTFYLIMATALEDFNTA